MKIAIFPKNIECCDGLRPGPGHPSGPATTKGPGPFVAIGSQRPAPWYTMYTISDHIQYRRTTQKGPHGHHLQPH